MKHVKDDALAYNIAYLRGMRAMQDRILNELNAYVCKDEAEVQAKYAFYRFVSNMPVVPDPSYIEEFEGHKRHPEK